MSCIAFQDPTRLKTAGTQQSSLFSWSIFFVSQGLTRLQKLGQSIELVPLFVKLIAFTGPNEASNTWKTIQFILCELYLFPVPARLWTKNGKTIKCICLSTLIVFAGHDEALKKAGTKRTSLFGALYWFSSPAEALKQVWNNEVHFFANFIVCPGVDEASKQIWKAITFTFVKPYSFSGPTRL